MAEAEEEVSDGPTRVEKDRPGPNRRDSAGISEWLKGQVQDSFGTRLGRFTLLKVLGEGGMGVVFAAYDEELDRKVAIKLLRTEAKMSAGGDDWLLNEAKAMARLSHPNIVQVYDVGEAEGAYFVAMEFVAGESLRDWFQRGKRSWREVVGVLAQAGRGLQAAHEAGLVHCDFKPQNVLVGRDGRVRVLDFGLAQLRERTRAASSPKAPDDSHRTTMIAGTPAYMAPELYLQGTPDARTDQFAFCVVLHEGLHGVRPFVGATFGDIKRAICAGEITPPPASSGVPKWLRRAVARGIAHDPSQRWPSMEALLAELARDPARTARRWLFAGGVASLVGLSVVSTLERRALEAELTAHRCDAVSVGDAWGPEQRDAVQAAIVGSGLAYAEDTATRVRARLDGYAAAWADMRVEACEAHGGGAQSDLLYERRVACLEQRRDDLAALVAVLRSADRDVVGKAVKAANDLRPLAACADAEALLAPIAPPETPEALAEVARLRKEIAAIRAEWSAGRMRPAKEKLVALTPAIDAVAYRPLSAEAKYLAGMLEDSLGDYKAASALLEAALWLAEASRDDLIVAEAAIRLIYVTGYRLARLEESALWERLAVAVMDRRGGPRELESRALSVRATVRMRTGELDEALRFSTAALAAAERIYGAKSYEVAVILGNLGSVAGMNGKHDLAASYLRRALDLLGEVLGPEHPDVATLTANAGVAAFGLGDFATAREYLERALAIYEHAVGRDTPDVARIYHNLGSLHDRSGEFDAALAMQLKALEMRRRLLGESHTDTANTEATVGESYLELGQPVRALEYIDRAAASHLASVGDKHSRYGATLVLHGRAELALGRTRAALATLERGLAILTAATTPHEHLGEAHFWLAQALWSTPRTRARALAEARAGRADFAAAGKNYAREVAEVDAWLAERDAPPP